MSYSDERPLCVIKNFHEKQRNINLVTLSWVFIENREIRDSDVIDNASSRGDNVIWYAFLKIMKDGIIPKPVADWEPGGRGRKRKLWKNGLIP